MQARHQPVGDEGRGRADLEHVGAAVIAQPSHGLAQAVEALFQLGKEDLGAGGQFDAAVDAAEKAHAQHVFQDLDLVADGGRRDVQFFGGLLQAAVAGG